MHVTSGIVTCPGCNWRQSAAQVYRQIGSNWSLQKTGSVGFTAFHQWQRKGDISPRAITAMFSQKSKMPLCQAMCVLGYTTLIWQTGVFVSFPPFRSRSLGWSNINRKSRQESRKATMDQTFRFNKTQEQTESHFLKMIHLVAMSGSWQIQNLKWHL